MSIDDIRNRLIRANGTHRRSSYPFITDLFKTMDQDHSRLIEYHEFKAGLELLGLRHLNEEEMRNLFMQFDKTNCGKVGFSEFVSTLRPPLSKSRLKVIDEAYNALDVNKDGVLSIEDFRVLYSEQAKQHPKYLEGEWTLDQVLKSFLDAFDTPGQCDGKVTKQEFLNYYSIISATISEDSYFDLLIRRSFNLPLK